MKSLLKYFSSVNLAITLLIIITLVSVLGTFIPQQRSAVEYAQHYGQLANFLIRLEFTDLYHSWWFIGLLFFFSLNIIVCSLTRLSPKLRKSFKPKLEKEETKINALKIKNSFTKHWPLAKSKEELKKEFSSKHYRLKEGLADKKILLLARKRILGPFGADIVHLGLLVILAGGIFSGFGGLRVNLNISEGQILPVPNAEFKLRLDKFDTEYYQDGSVRDWKSTLTVIEDGKPSLTKTIEVNTPLSYRGFVFYQSSYGWNWENPFLEIWVKKRTEPSFLNKIKLKVGERAKLEDEAIEISLLRFIPDFVINEKNEIATRSLQPDNPAASIEGWQDGEKIFEGWIFANFPDFARIHSEKETELSFELKDFEADQYSGIQVAKDPGVNFIWAGSVLLMIGLCLAFYWPNREIKVILEERNGNTEVTIGGIALKNKETFQSEFENIVASYRRLK
ncbi:cytochrome c biogenesis protein ResB [Acidobacteriota bacterium]